MTWCVKATERTTLAKWRDTQFKWAKQVTNLQVDITSHCNARCGACIRNKNGDEVKDELTLEHFDMEVCELSNFGKI